MGPRASERLSGWIFFEMREKYFVQHMRKIWSIFIGAVSVEAVRCKRLSVVAVAVVIDVASSGVGESSLSISCQIDLTDIRVIV